MGDRRRKARRALTTITPGVNTGEGGTRCEGFVIGDRRRKTRRALIIIAPGVNTGKEVPGVRRG